MYVDDILITCRSPQLVDNLISKLRHKFALKKLGEANYFLGFEVHAQQGGVILLTQTKYIRDLLNKENMEGVNGVNTPMANQCKLSKHDTNVILDPSHYRTIVGALQYVTLTRPYIAYSVNKAC